MRPFVVLIGAAMTLSAGTGTSAGASPFGPSPVSTPVPTLLASQHELVVAVSEEIEEHGTYLPTLTDGPVPGYGLNVDPASLSPATPAAEIKQNELLRVMPQQTCSHGIPVTYDHITVSFGKTTRTLPVDAPAWRATATGTYTAAVSLHYTWQATTESGEGNATFWFKLHVPRTRHTAH